MKPRPLAAAFFDAIARRYDREYGRSGGASRESLDWLLRELPVGARVLDLGVGTGRELPALLDAGHSPVGLDVSEAMLALCATRARPVPLVMADLWERLPFEDASFDAVIALHGTLAHAPSEAARVAFPHEVARVLRPGGVFLAEVPTDAWVDALPPGASLVPFGGGKARFVDPKTGASVDVWASSPEGWRALFATSLPSRVEPGLPGEARLVARKRLADHPSSDVTGPGDSSAQDDAGRGKVAAGHR